MNTTGTSATEAPQFSITRTFDAPRELALTPIPRGERTEFVFQLRGYEAKPGDGFVYDGWDEALTNFCRHLAGEKLG